MFEKASRLKLRFVAMNVGSLSVEDLWDLPLTSKTNKANLDDIARALHRQLKNDDDVSFVETSRKSDERTQLMFDIVRHVIDVKLAENAAKNAAEAIKEEKQKLLQALAEKKDDAIKKLTVEEIEAKLKSLQ